MHLQIMMHIYELPYIWTNTHLILQHSSTRSIHVCNFFHSLFYSTLSLFFHSFFILFFLSVLPLLYLELGSSCLLLPWILSCVQSSQRSTTCLFSAWSWSTCLPGWIFLLHRSLPTFPLDTMIVVCWKNVLTLVLDTFALLRLHWDTTQQLIDFIYLLQIINIYE